MFREGTIIHPPSKDEGLRDIEQTINKALDTRKSFLGVINGMFMVSYLVHYRTLLQNVTIILLQIAIKNLLQNSSSFLIQNMTV